MFRLHPKTSDTKVCIQQDLDGNIDDFKLSGSEMKALSILHYSEMFFHAHGKIPAVWLPFQDIMSTPKDLKKRGKERGGKREPPSWTHAPSHLNRYTTCTVYASVVPFCSEGHQHTEQPEYQMWARWVFKPFECISRQPFLVALLCPGKPRNLKLKVISYNYDVN